MGNIVLSIITPYYDTLKYTIELYRKLIPQLNERVEWIIVDDGCHDEKLDRIASDGEVLVRDEEGKLSAVNGKYVRIIHLEENSGNASKPRNVGLDNAKGKYIGFIDSDDLVDDNYIETILNKIDTEDFDYCIMSWRTKDDVHIIEEDPPEWNKCVWDCVYKRDIIGDERFDLNRNLGEDGDFNDRVRKGKRANILQPIYFYNWRREGSISNRHRDGLLPFQKNNQ
ncbi:MAG: glycosyltransferase family 2 protein [Bacilli bacterium]|nr:glycosyltransferase family 2 protein [Bacilli bacterium]